MKIINLNKKIYVVVFGLMLGSWNVSMASELTIQNPDTNGSISGYENLVNVGTSGGLIVTRVIVSDLFTASPTVTAFSDSPINGSSVIPESANYFIEHGTFEDASSPGNFTSAYSLLVINICRERPGFEGGITIKSVSAFFQSRETRKLTCVNFQY